MSDGPGDTARAARFVAWALADRSEFGRAGCRATDAEIAAELGVAENTVKMRYCRLRSRGHIDWDVAYEPRTGHSTLFPVLATDQLSIPRITMDPAPDCRCRHRSGAYLMRVAELRTRGGVAMTAQRQSISSRTFQFLNRASPKSGYRYRMRYRPSTECRCGYRSGTCLMRAAEWRTRRGRNNGASGRQVVQDIRTLDPTLSEMRLSLPHAAIGLEPSVGADTDPELPHASR